MKTGDARFGALEALSLARKVANHANALGAGQMPKKQRSCNGHLGAIMADAILQSGVNYRTVVYPRVSIIVRQYPEARSLQGVKEIINTEQLIEFLRWRHPTKLTRFLKLTGYLDNYHIDTPDDLRNCFDQDFRRGLLQLSGIGPKTVDYLSCLVGIDAIAVDRHIKSFARECGVSIDDYNSLRIIFSYAADLLELPRRDFDSWVWTIVSSRRAAAQQLQLPI